MEARGGWLNGLDNLISPLKQDDTVTVKQTNAGRDFYKDYGDRNSESAFHHMTSDVL